MSYAKLKSVPRNRDINDIFVTKPSLPPLDEFYPYLEEIWQRCVVTNNGPFHFELENALAEYLGVEFISLFANGTLALITALQALDAVGEVITTPYSFVATSHSLLFNNIKPVFVDIEDNGFNIDPSRVADAITPDTSAILPVHCYGTPCDVESIKDVSSRNNIPVLYDAAHAFGVKYKGKSLLSYGDLSVLSFHATKVFTTIEGGAVICKNHETKARIDKLKNFGIVDEVTVSALGSNGKMSELNSAFGLLQLKHIDAKLERRRMLAKAYRHHLDGVPGLKILQPDINAVENGSYFPILIDQNFSMSRNQLYDHLKSKGIYSRRYFYPLISEFSMYRDLPSANPANLPNATRMAQQIICLPIYPDLRMDDLKRIVDTVRAAAR